MMIRDSAHALFTPAPEALPRGDTEPLTDLACKIYDLAHEAPAGALYGCQISYLRMAADRIEERMIADSRIITNALAPPAQPPIFTSASTERGGIGGVLSESDSELDVWKRPPKGLPSLKRPDEFFLSPLRSTAVDDTKAALAAEDANRCGCEPVAAQPSELAPGGWLKAQAQADLAAGRELEIRDEICRRLTEEAYDIIYEGEPEDEREPRWKWVTIGIRELKNDVLMWKRRAEAAEARLAEAKTGNALDGLSLIALMFLSERTDFSEGFAGFGFASEMKKEVAAALERKRVKPPTQEAP